MEKIEAKDLQAIVDKIGPIRKAVFLPGWPLVGAVQVDKSRDIYFVWKIGGMVKAHCYCSAKMMAMPVVYLTDLELLKIESHDNGNNGRVLFIIFQARDSQTGKILQTGAFTEPYRNGETPEELLDAWYGRQSISSE